MFINRRQEIDAVTRETVLNHNRSRLIIITGSSGIGKTSLVDHCLTGKHGRKVFSVSVENHPRNKDDDRLFLIRLASTIIARSKSDLEVPQLQDVLCEMHGAKAFQAFCASLAKHFGEKLIGKSAFGVLEAVSAGLIAGNATLPEMMASELELYVQRVVSNQPSIIRIDNVQLIDRRSLSFFLNLFSDTNNLLGIFEVTNTRDDNSFAETLVRNFEERQIEVRALVLKKLDLEELIFGLRDKPEELVGLVARSYAQSDGNLHPLTLLATYADNGLKFRDALNYANVTKELILELPREERIVLCSVIAHGGLVPIEILRALFADMPTLTNLAIEGFDFSRACEALERKPFLVKAAGLMRVRHDSVIQTAQDIPVTQTLIVALEKVWRDFYSSLKAENDDFYLPAAEILDWLTYFNSRLNNSVQVLNCLEEIGRRSFDSIAPRRLLDYLESIRRKLTRVDSPVMKATLDALLRQQALLLYEAGWFEEALECLNEMHNSDISCGLLKAELFCSIGRAAEGLEVAEKMAASATGEASLCVNLIRIHGLRMLDRLDECRSLFFQLIHEPTISASMLYPTLLRFADLALNRDEDQERCIGFIEKSIALCNERNLKREEALARMALINQIGYHNVGSDVLEHMNAIEEISSTIWIQRYPVINNRAVFDMFRDECTEGTLQTLSQALVLCSEFLDRLLVKNNQMIALCILGRHEATEKLLYELISSVESQSAAELEIKKIVLFNISQVLRRYSRDDEAEPYVTRAKEIDTNIDREFWDAALGGKSVR